MRISSGKPRAPIPFDISPDNTGSSSYKEHHLTSANDSTLTTYTVSEFTSGSSFTTTGNDLDVTALTDDEVRERFKSVMVSISCFSSLINDIISFHIFKDDLIEGNEAKKKMFEQTTTAHMREMLSSHYKLATVSQNEYFYILLKTKKSFE